MMITDGVMTFALELRYAALVEMSATVPGELGIMSSN